MDLNTADETLNISSAALERIRRLILNAIERTRPRDPVILCGNAALSVLPSRPDDALRLAYSKLNSWPFANIPICWRRLHEDASLSKAAQILAEMSAGDGPSHQGLTSGKRRRLNDLDVDRKLTVLVEVLDKGIMLSGVPARSAIFEQVFSMLEDALASSTTPPALSYHVQSPLDISIEQSIEKADGLLTLEDFQVHLDKSTTPMVIPGALDTWPALELWQDPGHLLRSTLDGRRLVPIEVGRSYTDDDWSQQLVPFARFLQDYVLPESPRDIGYLAQHDLFQQLPALRRDILIPEFCYSMPPSADAATLKTAGLSTVSPLDEPLLNAWFGPKGTKTPLHTDPYHNVLCQVVGYKYVRLYAPGETAKVYPRGVDESGISMENTSLIDVSFFRPQYTNITSDAAGTFPDESFPLFNTAEYQETILGPGECLYIPLGWWHYVESLTTSFSVSFWWN